MYPEDSILGTVKTAIGLPQEYTPFDADLILLVNSVLATLTQMGIGPVGGFVITGPNETWTDFVGDDECKKHTMTYVGLKTKMLFDPPANSSLSTVYDNEIKELEWRIGVKIDGTLR